MATRTITGTFYHPVTAEPWAGVDVTFRLAAEFVTGSTVVPVETSTVTTESDGTFSVTLMVPDTGTAQYEIAYADQSFVVNLASGAATTLAALVAASGSTVTQSAITTAIDALLASDNTWAGENVFTAVNGMRPLMVAYFTFDPSANAAMRTIGDHGLGVTLPAGAILTGIGYTSILECTADFHSASDAGTIALSLEAAADILSPTAAQSLTVGNQSGDMSSTFFKTTVAREITATVAVEDLTAGKLHGFLTYVVSE